MIRHLFSTPVLREATGLRHAQLEEIASYLLNLAAAGPGEIKSNRGGWHSEGNLFSADFRQFPAMRAAVTRAMLNYLSEALGYAGELSLELSGWTVINRPGDHNVVHNHAGNLLTGALYIAIPESIRGGALVFQDPRLSLNSLETDAMRSLGVRPPWLSPIVNLTPAAGDIVIFPSWLNHYVEPFTSDDPGAVRIVISFNAAI